ncbi:neutral zinc metallopeptidase [Solwaraspora sp. WMMD406]|uniref:neutral zinc metallopeptidase n=1 Tax=Solwaraspora sp. WMMD406 TaxID=3016095 RepID=UPI0024161F10|nr:neutral zinc metallopeptidase [Solwaraspora sp. WMMD406]MDG4766248.1 neutral zinc metallopeptidase [Solwaraspora sp. WMMD406]
MDQPGDRRWSPARLAALCVAVVAAGACAVAPLPGGEQGEPNQPAAPGAEPTRADGEDLLEGTDTVEEFEQDIEGAERLADQYWSQRFAGFGAEFQPIGRTIPYYRDGEVSCGDQLIPRNNAVYCLAGGTEFIAYDANWAFTVFQAVGDSFLFYLIGHEYAHGIQVRLELDYSFSIQRELAADCLAGAYLGDSVRDGALRLDDGDLEEFRLGLEAVADDPNQPWFEEGSHGTADQRIAAFFRGYDGSLAGCDLS